MTTIKELIERKEKAEAELAAANEEIATRHGEVDPEPEEKAAKPAGTSKKA